MNYICESCGSDLKYYDKVSRMVRTKNRKASIITVKRFKCPVCNCIQGDLYHGEKRKQHSRGYILILVRG